MMPVGRRVGSYVCQLGAKGGLKAVSGLAGGKGIGLIG